MSKTIDWMGQWLTRDGRKVTIHRQLTDDWYIGTLVIKCMTIELEIDSLWSKNGFHIKNHDLDLMEKRRSSEQRW